MSVDYFLVDEGAGEALWVGGRIAYGLAESSGRSWTERILWSAVSDRHDVDPPLRWAAALLTWLGDRDQSRVRLHSDYDGDCPDWYDIEARGLLALAPDRPWPWLVERLARVEREADEQIARVVEHLREMDLGDAADSIERGNWRTDDR